MDDYAGTDKETERGANRIAKNGTRMISLFQKRGK